MWDAGLPLPDALTNTAEQIQGGEEFRLEEVRSPMGDEGSRDQNVTLRTGLS